jgi:predicted porin
MNKKLLTAAIAAGLMVPGLAAADVKIFGTIQAETSNIDIDTQAGGADFDTTLMGGGANGATNGGGPNTIGFKGDEKLGNGLTAYFKVSTQFETFDNDTGNGIDARDSFVGVKGDGWHVHFGKMATLYKTASHKWDPFVATGLQQRGTGAISNLHNGYADNLGEVGFKSGAWSGGVQISWEDSTNDAKTLTNDSPIDAGSWNGRVKYKGNNWEAFFTYMDLDYGTASGDADAWKIGGKYAANGWSVAAVYEDTDASTAAIGGTFRPDGSGSGLWGNSLNSTGVGGIQDMDSLSIDVTYSLSDATTLLATYANADYDGVAGTPDVDTD